MKQLFNTLMQSAWLCHSRDIKPGRGTFKVRKAACWQEPIGISLLHYDKLPLPWHLILAHFTCVIVKFVKAIMAHYDIYVYVILVCFSDYLFMSEEVQRTCQVVVLSVTFLLL